MCTSSFITYSSRNTNLFSAPTCSGYCNLVHIQLYLYKLCTICIIMIGNSESTTYSSSLEAETTTPWIDTDKTKPVYKLQSACLQKIVHCWSTVCFLTMSSTTEGSASVDTSPNSSCWLEPIFLKMRRMIFPERVLGRPGTICVC